MKSQEMQAQPSPVQKLSLIARGVSWLILKTLAVLLLTVFAGIAFSIYKYFVPDPRLVLVPVPFSPAAVYASPVQPIDYRQHPSPQGATAMPAPPLPAFASGPPRHPVPLTHKVPH